ncbi:hypothetical protein PsorP6_010901 [Peronosclerospora sorghi]|uniref:Uncharacterized protein n=1 Tax=Peronosclerospora sorghi TaxID=230839 RepID=A0ACC0VV87_9STRA|nr:hypothetical protein PsorP6_010901 [Peronosclerospora sorghi]
MSQITFVTPSHLSGNERSCSASRTRAAAPRDTPQSEAQNAEGHAAHQQAPDAVPASAAQAAAAQQGVNANSAMMFQIFQIMQQHNFQSHA